MLEFLTAYLPLILSTVTAVALGVVSIVKLVVAKRTGVDSVESKALTTITDGLTKVYKQLPNLIAFSETANAGSSGEEKKEFVIEYIKQMFAMLNIELDEASLTAISTAIDDIVKVTKKMHTGVIRR